MRHSATLRDLCQGERKRVDTCADFLVKYREMLRYDCYLARAAPIANANTWWRPRFTPVHASWLNQAEILIHGFSHHYLKRQSWHSRDEFIEHVIAAWPEYNDRYAKPIEWTWTNHKMRRWFEKHAH